MSKQSLVKFGAAEGYTPEEFATELLETVIALGMMNLDKQNIAEGTSNTKISWTMECDDNAEYKISVEKLK